MKSYVKTKRKHFLQKNNKTKKKYHSKYSSKNYLYKNILVSNDKLYLNFKNKLEPGKFLNKFLGYKYVDPILFYNNFINDLNNHFLQNNASELHKLIKTNKSCKYPLFWQIIIIPPGTTFSYHIHPNMEYDYVVDGTLHTYYLKDKLSKSHSCVNYSHNKIFKSLKFEDFEYKKAEKHQALINDSGSCHISYTKDDGCVLYSLWSGHHIGLGETPNFFKDINL